MTTGSQEQEQFIAVELPKIVGVSFGVRNFVVLLFCVAFLGAIVGGIYVSVGAQNPPRAENIVGPAARELHENDYEWCHHMWEFISTGKEEFGHDCPRKRKEFEDLSKRAMLAMHR